MESSQTPHKGAATDFLKDELEAGKQKVSELADSALAAGRDKLDDGLKGSAQQVDQVKEVIGEATSKLKSRQMDGIAQYTEQLATSLGSLSDRLRNSSVDQLASDARTFARTHPALFVAGSVAIGFGLTRLLKAAPTTTRPEADVQPAYAPQARSADDVNAAYPL